MLSPTSEAMSRDEMRAGGALASVFALRMLGLFLILPVFAVHAQGIPGGDDLMLVGIALGAYGLTQAMFQIPFGMASEVGDSIEFRRCSKTSNIVGNDQVQRMEALPTVDVKAAIQRT